MCTMSLFSALNQQLAASKAEYRKLHDLYSLEKSRRKALHNTMIVSIAVFPAHSCPMFCCLLNRVIFLLSAKPSEVQYLYAILGQTFTLPVGVAGGGAA